MYKLCFYVPESHLETVKAALFLAGAGRIGNYDSCCWQILGQGQFRPLDGSNPTLGEPGVLEVLGEYKVEMVLEDSLLPAIVAALRESHPYEEPAYDLCPITGVE